MNKVKNCRIYSYLLSRGTEFDDKITSEDLINILNMNVNTCQIDLYKEVIRMISEGKTYDEIFEYIDSYNGFETDELLEDQKIYVKKKVKRDLIARKNFDEKGDK